MIDDEFYCHLSTGNVSLLDTQEHHHFAIHIIGQYIFNLVTYEENKDASNGFSSRCNGCNFCCV